MKVITCNLNGIRSAQRKGFFTWVRQQQADVICLQELKAQAADMENDLFYLEGYQSYFHCAEKKGYSGVGIYTKHPAKQVVTGLDWEVAQQEGRYVAIDLGNVWVASLYLPSGTAGDHRQIIKYDFLERYAAYLQSLQQAKHHYIICGDWNIAHQQIDLKNWRSNQKNSGFLPKEREWMDHLLGEMGFVDAFRVINQESEQYTWWSNRGRAYEKNVGWRIDYQIISSDLKSRVRSAEIYKNERFSDHAPLILEYDMII